MDLRSRLTGLDLERDELGAWPSRVEWAQPLGLWVKREDQASPVYGGNKVRKLQYLLPVARARHGGQLMSVGALGSNHLVACCLHGRRFGVDTHALVIPQPSTPHVLKNAGVLAANAASIETASNVLVAATWSRFTLARRVREQTGHDPLWVYAGGSNPLGTLGWVEGALELAEQVRAGELPEPEQIFVPMGSCGTVAGLLLGLSLTELKTEVHAVRVVDRVVCNRWTALRLARRTLALLKASGARELPEVQPGRLVVHHDQFGGGYGCPTPQGAEAQERAAAAGLKLEPTYTAKALAAALSAVAEGRTVLYVDTVNSSPLPDGGDLGPLQVLL
jgi:D-cysteine desulfhydrase